MDIILERIVIIKQITINNKKFKAENFKLMKRIFIALMLCMVSISGFAEVSRFQKVIFPTELTDGYYIICYETNTKVKIFQRFDEFAISIKKESDSTILCEDSLAWELEKIDSVFYTLLNSHGEYLHREGTDECDKQLILSISYGLICVNDYGLLCTRVNSNAGCWWRMVDYNIEKNCFYSYRDARWNYKLEPNTLMYRKIEQSDTITATDTISNTPTYLINHIKYQNYYTKQIKNGIFVIGTDNGDYDILGNKIK